MFLEAVLWIARTGSPWRDLPAIFGKSNTVFPRYRYWLKADVSRRFSKRCLTTRTWNTPWSTPPSSRSMSECLSLTINVRYATASTQEGASEPGYRQVQRRFDDENSGAHRCAGNRVRLVLLPGQLHGKDRRRATR
jgi:transposase